jgi:hypothetical protein
MSSKCIFNQIGLYSGESETCSEREELDKNESYASSAKIKLKGLGVIDGFADGCTTPVHKQGMHLDVQVDFSIRSNSGFSERYCTTCYRV